MAPEKLLQVRELRVYFGSPTRPVRAVDGVTFEVRAGETVALVGESGCGKTVTALSLARLVPEPPGWYAGGEVCYCGLDVLKLRRADLRRLRGGEMAYVFQEPADSLNPVLTIGYQIAEAIRLHRKKADSRSLDSLDEKKRHRAPPSMTEPARVLEGQARSDATSRSSAVRRWGGPRSWKGGFREPADVRTLAIDWLERVGLPDPEALLKAYPHQLSGGMQQRVMLAMALACRPKLLVADEPTTALDVTIQAEIMDLLLRLQADLGVAILLITHNLGLVARIAHRLYVMYAGQLVEAGPVRAVLDRPAHPYTRALLEAVPRLRGSRARVWGIPGAVPNPAHWPAGCRFHPRCPLAQSICCEEVPANQPMGEDRAVACHFWRLA